MLKRKGGGAGRILNFFSAVPHETEEMVKISPMARLRAHARNFCITMLAKMCFFGGALFFIWGHQLATFLDQPAMLEENLSQKKTWLPQITPKFGQKRALGGPKIGQFFVTVLSKHR